MSNSQILHDNLNKGDGHVSPPATEIPIKSEGAPIKISTAETVKPFQTSQAVENTATGGIASNSKDLIDEDVAENNVATATTITKRKRPTDAETATMMETIKDELSKGHPLQAIALKHGVSLSRVLKLFAKLMNTDFRNEVTVPTYEVVPAGTPVSKLPFDMFTDTKFIRVEFHENGIYIQPFNMENYNA